MRELKVKLEDLADAFDFGSDEIAYYLDRETGEVVMVTDDARQQIKKLLGAKEAQTAETAREAIRAAELPDWDKEAMYAAAAVKWADRGRFLKVPQVTPGESYQEMADFVETVSDERVQMRLFDAIRGKGAFRRFKDTLARYPEERERWFKYRDARTRERGLNWLREKKIQVIETDGEQQG